MPKRKRKKRRSSSKSGYIGVTKKSSGKYEARITIDSKQITIGSSYDTAKQAAKAYDKEAIKLRRPFSKLNYPKTAPVGYTPIQKALRSDNTVGYRGVSKKRKKFIVQISISGKRSITRGFETAKEAAIAYDRAVLKANKSTSLLNFPDMVHNLDVEPKRKKQKVRSSTGYRGVSNGYKGRFNALIRIGNKKKRLGTFDTAIKAALAYDQAAIKKGNKKSTLNFPDGLQIKVENTPTPTPLPTPLPSRSLTDINARCDKQHEQWNGRQKICAHASAGLLDYLRNGTEVGPLPPIASTDELSFTFETEDNIKIDLVMTTIKDSPANMTLRKYIEREMHIIDNDEDSDDGSIACMGDRRPRQWVQKRNVKEVFDYLRSSINNRKSEANKKTEEGCGFLILPGIIDGISHILTWVELTDGTPIIVDPTIADNKSRCFHDGLQNDDYLSIETFERFFRDDVKVQIEPIFVLWCAGGKLSEVAQEHHSMTELVEENNKVKKEVKSEGNKSLQVEVPSV